MKYLIFTSICFFSFQTFANEISRIPLNQFIIPEKREFKLSETIQPCDNFYEYVCSEEIKKIQLPEEYPSYSFYTDESNLKYKKLINEFIKNKMINLFNKYGGQGENSLRENIADYIGLNSIYKVLFSSKYKSYIPLQKEFFINYAKLYCEVSLPIYNEKRVKNDTHSSPKFRVNNILRLSKDFEDTYSCKKGDPMTLPENERVSFW